MVLFISCEKNYTYEKVQGIDDYSWDQGNKLAFTVEIEDTSATYNMYLIVRHTADYQFTNLYVNLHTFYPSGKKGSLLKSIELGDNTKLSWLGECMNDICDRQEEIVEGIKFQEKGEYKFLVEQIMRTNPLDDVMGVGLKIVKQPE